MEDQRLEFSRLTGSADGSAIVQALDSTRIVVSADPARTVAREDQAALYNLVSSAARLFAHVELRLPEGIKADLAPLADGDLRAELEKLRADLAPTPTAQAVREFHLAWASEPEGDGLSGDAASWSYSVGPHHLALPRSTGPAVGALAASCFLTAQAFGHALQGQVAFHPTAGFVANLLDHQNAPAPAVEHRALHLSELALFGCGSVGSSALYAALLIDAAGGPMALVDPDPFRARNRLRYPILRKVVEGDAKVEWLRKMADHGAIVTKPYETDIQGFLDTHENPPALPLVLVSVDTVEGRRDATDALALTTLNAGVSGMQLHAARHGFGEDGCAYCQYVEVAPTLSGAQALAERVGLPFERVIAILDVEGGLVSDADAEQMRASGRFQGEPPRPGERLADLDRRIYAQASVQTPEGEVRISTPFVSAMAGVLLLAEAVKEAQPELHSYRLEGRYDIDMSGEPTGITSATPRDPLGRCLCHSPFRRAAHRQLHGFA
jgi:hypothetical protein